MAIPDIGGLRTARPPAKLRMDSADSRELTEESCSKRSASGYEKSSRLSRYSSEASQHVADFCVGVSQFQNLDPFQQFSVFVLQPQLETLFNFLEGNALQL